jgi:hypothetical protein
MAMKTLLLLTSAVSLTGCALPQTVKKLPAPSFAAPTIVQQQPEPVRVATPTKPVPAKTPIAVKPAPAAPASGPKDWAPQATVRPWKYIVIHHSATPAGGAAAFDKMHKAKGWDGLGYDFVIGNGTDTRDGQIEVGFRWKQQLVGAHARTANNAFNEYGIGICLVGNFDIDKPTPAQMASLARLTAHLMKTYRVGEANVIGHGDTKATDCPGKFLNIATVKAMARHNLATGSARTTPEAYTSNRQLIAPAGR